MVAYKYSALSQSGQRVSGIVEAFNEMDAAERIKQNHSIVLKITPIKEGGVSGLMSMDLGANKLDIKAFTVMCNQFAIILRSGIPIARTVNLIAAQTTNKPLKKLLTKVSGDVEAGRSLSTSFAEHGSKLLPETFIETIRAGEESGSLDHSFETVSVHFEKRSKMKGKVRSAISYPLFVLVIAVIVVIVLMVKVVPTFMSIFDSYGAELPVPTKILIAISNFFSSSWMILLAIVLILVIAYKLYNNSETGRMNVAKLKLRAPILGNIGTLNAASQFANTMSVMLASGLSIPRAISITAKVIDNYYISSEIKKVTAKIEEGRRLGACMREMDCMPDILVDMVNVGEETGEMEDTLRTIGEYYDSELEMATAAALAKLEPTMLVGLAVVAGFIVIAIYMAMFDMYGAM